MPLIIRSGETEYVFLLLLQSFIKTKGKLQIAPKVKIDHRTYDNCICIAVKFYLQFANYFHSQAAAIANSAEEKLALGSLSNKLKLSMSLSFLYKKPL